MSRSLSWIDQDQLAVALARAGALSAPPSRPARRPLRPRPDSSPSAAMEPRATSSDQPNSTPATAAQTTNAVDALLETVSATAPTFQPPRTFLRERLGALIDWVVDQTQAKRVFIADAEGLVLLEQESDPDLVAASSSFIDLLERVRGSLGPNDPGALTIDLGTRQVLNLCRVATDLGRFSLGVVTERPLPQENIRSYQDALSRTLEETN